MANRTTLRDVTVSFAREGRTAVFLRGYMFFYYEGRFYVCEYLYAADGPPSDSVHGTCVFTGERDDLNRLLIRNMENGRYGTLENDMPYLKVRLKLDGAVVTYYSKRDDATYVVTIKKDLMRVEYVVPDDETLYLEYRRDGTRARYECVYDERTDREVFKLVEETRFENDPDMDDLIDEALANAKFVRGDEDKIQ